MDDYKSWCRLCGGLSSLPEINGEILPVLEDVFKLQPDEYRVCTECHPILLQFHKIYTRSKDLAKMFKGLDEENLDDLDIVRLNAYRTHFDLPTSIPIFTEQIVEEEIIVEMIEPIEIEEIAVEGIIEEEMIEEVSDEEELEVTETDKMFNFQCHICENVIFLKFYDLQHHVKKTHLCPPQVRCCDPKCGKILCTWRRLLIHKEKHFPSEKALKCGICFRVFETTKGLEKHKKLHDRQFVCSYCAKIFMDKKICRFHERTHESNIEERRNFECSHCAKKFTTKQACQNHIAQNHEKVKRFFCTRKNCDKGFYTQKGLCEHQRTHRGRLHPCDKCDFKGKTKNGLQSHMESHITTMDYKCELCDGEFPSKRRLTNHMIVHSEKLPFPCSQCNAKFKRKKDLDNHLRIHSSVKAFKCTFCPRTFNNASNCRKHKKKDHPMELEAYEAEHGKGRVYANKT